MMERVDKLGKPRIELVAAIGARTRALGKDGGLVWDLPEELKHFREITRGYPVIMGRKTWESIPEKNRPMRDRRNIVISGNPDFEAPGAEIVHSFAEALAAVKDEELVRVIGGRRVFEDALPYTDQLVLTLVDDDSPSDVQFPEYPEFTKTVFQEPHEENGIKYEYVTLERA